jgi:hypothetical protein
MVGGGGMNPADPIVTRKALAAALGCKPSYINTLRAAGRVVLADDGKHYRLEATRRRIAETKDPSHQAVADRHTAARGAPLAGIGGAGQGADSAPAPIAAPAPAEAASAPDDAIAAVSPSFAEARAMREHYQAQQAKLDWQVRIGELIERKAAEARMHAGYTTARARAESWPDLLAPQLVAIDDEARIRGLLAEAVHLMLTELQRDLALVDGA